MSNSSTLNADFLWLSYGALFFGASLTTVIFLACCLFVPLIEVMDRYYNRIYEYLDYDEHCSCECELENFECFSRWKKNDPNMSISIRLLERLEQIAPERVVSIVDSVRCSAGIAAIGTGNTYKSAKYPALAFFICVEMLNFGLVWGTCLLRLAITVRYEYLYNTNKATGRSKDYKDSAKNAFTFFINYVLMILLPVCSIGGCVLIYISMGYNVTGNGNYVMDDVMEMGILMIGLSIIITRIIFTLMKKQKMDEDPSRGIENVTLEEREVIVLNKIFHAKMNNIKVRKIEVLKYGIKVTKQDNSIVFIPLFEEFRIARYTEEITKKTVVSVRWNDQSYEFESFNPSIAAKSFSELCYQRKRNIDKELRVKSTKVEFFVHIVQRGLCVQASLILKSRRLFLKVGDVNNGDYRINRFEKTFGRIKIKHWRILYNENESRNSFNIEVINPALRGMKIVTDEDQEYWIPSLKIIMNEYEIKYFIKIFRKRKESEIREPNVVQQEEPVQPADWVVLEIEEGEDQQEQGENQQGEQLGEYQGENQQEEDQQEEEHQEEEQQGEEQQGEQQPVQGEDQ